MFVLGVAVITAILAQALRWKLDPWHVLLRNSVLPYLTYVVIVALYWLGMPSFYSLLVGALGNTMGRLTFFYVFPLIDTVLYALLLGLNSLTSPNTHEFNSQIHSLLQGYRVGIILLIGYYEVEFYYILIFFMLRNLFIGYVVEQQALAYTSIATSCWIIAYYINYLFCFIPIIGLHKTIISYNYKNYETTNTPTLLYGTNHPLYPSSTSYTGSDMNTSLQGSVFWLSALIIWVGDTFTQRYHNSRIDAKYIAYCLFGVYLFYVGLSSALNIQSLTL